MNGIGGGESPGAVPEEISNVDVTNKAEAAEVTEPTLSEQDGEDYIQDLKKSIRNTELYTYASEATVVLQGVLAGANFAHGNEIVGALNLLGVVAFGIAAVTGQEIQKNLNYKLGSSESETEERANES